MIYCVFGFSRSETTLFAKEDIYLCTWRSGVRSAMRAASQLPGKGPTDVDDAPAPAR